MTGTAPETAWDFSFGEDDGEWEGWLASDFDSDTFDDGRTPVASVGEILRQVREKMGHEGISQEEMALRLGIPERTYKSYETHEIRKVPAEVLRRVAAITDVDAEFLLTGRMRDVDHAPLLADAFQLAEHLVGSIGTEGDRLSYKDIQEVVIRVLAARDERRRLAGDDDAPYTQTDIGEAVWEHTDYSWRFRRAMAEGEQGG